MTAFERHIEFYRLNYAHQHFSKLVPEDKWGNKKLAEEYLQKYWLPEQEYLSIWKPIQDKVFVQGKSLPDLIYHYEFNMIVTIGGCLFAEEDFLQLQKIMQEVGEEYFVVVQNGQEYTNGEPMFRMKFPVNITWKELISGNYISAVLIEMSLNEYYVFGASGKWGRYSATDYILSLGIIGFKHELASIFKEHFQQSKKEQEEIQEWLPLNYRKLINQVLL
jgi:hypothetical protein